MSIFGKKKQTDNIPVPPPAPPGNIGGGLSDIKNEVSGGSFNNSEEINKTQLSSPMPPPPSMSQPSPMQSNFQSPPPLGLSGGQQPQNNSNSNNSNSNNVPKTVLDESLFNLEDFELPDLSDLDSITHQDSEKSSDQKKEDSVAASNSHRSNEINKSNHELSYHNSVVRDSLHLGNSDNFNPNSNFMPTKGLSHTKQDTYFLTTTEFKHLLELIDAVKDRVKISTQRHMKITSVKAEEDIEYENMKKDFQFIEDKLYEVDSTIFDR